MIMTK